jgi:hypothetical protein
MFVGALPKETLQQVARLVRLADVAEAYVCCSGSFRLEQTLSQLSPTLTIRGNDVSLVTCAVGVLAATGDCFPITFRGELAAFEEKLVGASPLERVAAILIAGQMSRFTGKSEHTVLHHQHYLSAFKTYLATAADKLSKIIASMRMTSFERVDFREHARIGAAKGALVLGFPPTYKGGYENLYKFLDRNIEWTPPSYEMFDPKDVGAWVRELHDSGTPYLVGCDQEVHGLKAAAAFSNSGKHTLFIYARTEESSLLRRGYTIKPFRYVPVDCAELTAKTEVLLVPVGAAEMNFLKEQYLARNIVHTAGHLNFLVYLGGKLAGGFIYTRSQHDPTKTIYLLSDFSIVRDRKISKLIAMLAASRDPVAVAERKMLIRPSSVFTTAFTKKPMSMKYRGIFELASRGEGFLNYASPVRQQSAADVYRDWLKRFAGPSAPNAPVARRAEGSHPPHD